MRYDATTYIILRIVRKHPDSSIAEIAAGTGIPAYIVRSKLARVAQTKAAVTASERVRASDGR